MTQRPTLPRPSLCLCDHLPYSTDESLEIRLNCAGSGRSRVARQQRLLHLLHHRIGVGGIAGSGVSVERGVEMRGIVGIVEAVGSCFLRVGAATGKTKQISSG
jgi:hypothetical protein